MEMLGRRLSSDLVSLTSDLVSFTSGPFDGKGDHPPNIKPQLMYVSSVWPLRHVFLEQSDTALEGITEITEHKKAEVTLAWRTHGIGS